MVRNPAEWARGGGAGREWQRATLNNSYSYSAQARVERFPWSFAPSLYEYVQFMCGECELSGGGGGGPGSANHTEP